MEAETNDCRIVLFLILIIQGGYGLYLCGSGMIQYDPKTHTCIQDVVQPISSVTERESIHQMERFIYCYVVKSDEIQLIDTYKFDCKNSTILKKTTPTPATTTSTTSVAQPTTSSDSDRARALASSACRCCNEVEGFSVHPRGSIQLPCQHSSTNDKFFSKMRHFNPSKIPDADFNRICEETKFVFRITVEKQRHTKDEPRFVARLTAWRFSPDDKRSKMSHLSSPYESERIKISLDKYSPTQNKLQRKPFLVLTNLNYFSQAVFFLKPDDHLYKFPKNTERLNRAFKRLGKKCRKARRKSRRGS